MGKYKKETPDMVLKKMHKSKKIKFINKFWLRFSIYRLKVLVLVKKKKIKSYAYFMKDKQAIYFVMPEYWNCLTDIIKIEYLFGFKFCFILQIV